MKYHILVFAALLTGSCANSAPVVQNTAGSNTQPPQNQRPQSVTAHTTEDRPPAGTNSNGPAISAKPGATGDPIDTAKFDGTIAEAEKALKAKPQDEGAKKTLADAYFDRGFALTEARQYASALGDYRRALKLDPGHEESQKWADQITGIYKMLKRDPPKEGEEPPPLPFKK